MKTSQSIIHRQMSAKANQDAGVVEITLPDGSMKLMSYLEALRLSRELINAANAVS